MQSLSTSVISLHSYVESPRKTTTKKTDTKPSFIYFLALFYTFLSMGFGTGLIGPTLLKFSEQTKSSLDRVVYILFTRSFGFLVGTLIGGALIDRFSSFSRTFLSFSVFIMCTTTLVIPFMYHIIPMIIIHFMWAFTAGVIDNLAQILTIRHYEQSNVNPYLQALHCAFGIGAFLSPLIIAPFLRKSSPPDQWHYAYWLIGCFQIPNFIWILFYAVRDEFVSKKIEEVNLENKEFVPEEKQNDKEIASDDKPKSPDDSFSRNILILSLMTIFVFLYVGTESSFGAYTHTYAILYLNFEKDIAAYLNAAFWASFSFGRLCGIPLSLKFSPLQMIFADLIGCISSLAAIFIFNKSSLILWIGSIFFGISVASVYASTIAYTEKHMPITGKTDVNFNSWEAQQVKRVIPLLIGYSINSKRIGPIGLIFISLVVVILASLLFGCMVLYVRYRSKSSKQVDE